MMSRRSVPLLLLPLAACAPDRAVYPSLAPRAVEARGWDEPAPAPAPTATPDPALDAQVAEQRRALAATDAAFGAHAARAGTLAAAARGDAVGGERWIAAQTALADLDADRAATVDAGQALGDLADRRLEGGLPDYPSLTEAAAAAEAQQAAETRRIRELQALLPQG